MMMDQVLGQILGVLMVILLLLLVLQMWMALAHRLGMIVSALLILKPISSMLTAQPYGPILGTMLTTVFMV